MRLGFTGTQRGLTVLQAAVLEAVVQCTRLTEFHHGDCVGADEDAHNIVRSLVPACHVHSWPCTIVAKRAWTLSDTRHEVMHPMDRNVQIVLHTDMLVACPGESQERQRSGTWATIRAARHACKPLVIIFPDGTTKEEP